MYVAIKSFNTPTKKIKKGDAVDYKKAWLDGGLIAEKSDAKEIKKEQD